MEKISAVSKDNDYAENPGKEVHFVRVSKGDGAIDVYAHQVNGINHPNFGELFVSSYVSENLDKYLMKTNKLAV